MKKIINLKVKVRAATAPAPVVATEDMVISLYYKGKSNSEIAKECGITPQKVAGIIKKFIFNKPIVGKLSTKDRKDIVAAVNNGASYASLARKYNVTPGTIIWHIKRSAKGAEMIPYSEKEAAIKNFSKKKRARDIAEFLDLEETTTRNYACARHVSLEFDRISYSRLEEDEIHNFICGTSKRNSVSELAKSMGRSVSSVYNKIKAEREKIAALPTVQ